MDGYGPRRGWVYSVFPEKPKRVRARTKTPVVSYFADTSKMGRRLIKLL
jgi:hypothetical protein